MFEARRVTTLLIPHAMFRGGFFVSYRHTTLNSCDDELSIEFFTFQWSLINHGSPVCHISPCFVMLPKGSNKVINCHVAFQLEIKFCRRRVIDWVVLLITLKQKVEHGLWPFILTGRIRSSFWYVLVNWFCDPDPIQVKMFYFVILAWRLILN